MSETTSTPEETREIEVGGKTYAVFKPTDGQLVALMRLEQAVQRMQGLSDADLDHRSPEVRRLVYRTSTIIAGMFNEADWWDIEDRMSAREVDWPEVMDIFVSVAKVWGTEAAPRRKAVRARRA